MMTKIVHDHLVQLMGGDAAGINIKGNPGIVLIAGLQGSGKTTFSGKLALHIKSKRGIRPLLVAGDVYRPAAMEQLRVLGQQIGVDVHIEETNSNPVKIAGNAIERAKKEGYGVVIIDVTIGRNRIMVFKDKVLVMIGAHPYILSHSIVTEFCRIAGDKGIHTEADHLFYLGGVDHQ